MSPAVMRGLSEENGSWKMICICRRYGRNSPFDRPMISVPSTLIDPSVGSVSRSTARPAVVLPQPLSPTRPSVSPDLMEKLIPSTA